LALVGVQEDDLQLAAIARVDEPRCVHDRDPVLCREARARLDEAGVALGDRNSESRADGRARSGCKLDAFAGGEIETCVAAVRARRYDRVVAQTLNRQLDHAPLTR